jgi:kynureninase
MKRQECLELDRLDPLAARRQDFELPADVIYLDGNSLGAAPRAVQRRLQSLIRQEWGEGLIRSWNEADWFTMPTRVGEKLAPLLGAGPGQVVAADSTSINLYKALVAALRLRPDRHRVIGDAANFPTDLYLLQAACQAVGGRSLERLDAEDIAAAIDGDTAVVALSHADYRSGQLHDMATISAAAHAAGALVVWDLAHSAGALALALDEDGADFAVGCGYKFLNGGPGAPAFLYVALRHQGGIEPVLPGWMGHANPFAFAPDYQPAPGIARNLCGTPPILSLAALEAALEIWAEVDLAALRHKSQALGQLLIDRVEAICAGHDLALASPRDPDQRGSQVSFHHPQGYALVQALIGRGVIGDFRDPDIMRFGLAPLYLRYVDVWDAAGHLAEILESGEWRQDSFRARRTVT